MIDWRMKVPMRLIAGKGSVTFLSELLAEMNLKNPFVIFDPNVKASDFGMQIGFSLNSFDEFSTNPTFEQVNNGVYFFLKDSYDSIIVIGGGSAIDLAKVVGLTVANGGRVEDYFQGKKAGMKPVPIIAIPTTCGTGAESSPFAVIMDSSVPRKRGVESHFFMPNVVILDPESLLSLKKVMIASTGIDTFTHILESHISRKATSLTKVISKGLLCSVRDSLERSLKNKDFSSLETLQSIAFTARLLYPRTGLSIAHALSHPLGAFTNMHHGLAVAMFLESSLKFNFPKCNDSIQEVERIMGFQRGGGLFSWIRSIMEYSGMAEEISTCLSPFDDLPVKRIALEAMQSSNIPSNPRKMELLDVQDIIVESLNFFGRKYDY